MPRYFRSRSSFFLFLSLLFANTVTSSQENGISQLPLAEERNILGSWGLDDNCSGSIILVGQKSFWATRCLVSTGIGNGTHGFLLVKQSPSQYRDEVRKTIYELNGDGSLDVKTVGRPDFHAKRIQE
jgi:hypothetical protein